MDIAKQHWDILQEIDADLANKVRSFLVIGNFIKGVLVATDDGEAFWFGLMKFGCEQESVSRSADQPKPLGVRGLVSMAQGDGFILLLNKRGKIYSLGQNYYGELGLGTVDDKTHFTPRLISSPYRFTSVRCGWLHSLALTDDGKVCAWGSNSYCQLGVPISTRSLSSPRQIPKLDLHRVVSVECGSKHSLALTNQGEVYAWGWNESGQLGYKSDTPMHTPTRISTPSPVRSIAAGSTHTLLLTQTGEVYACGENEFGQLGLPITTKFSPDLSKVAGLPPISQIASHPESSISIAMTFYNRCFVWGHISCERVPTPRKLPTSYSTVDSPLSFYSCRTTPHSVTIPDTPPNRLTARMSRMFDNPETSDVQFVVEQRKIHVHQNILSNSSDYFARMFSERWLRPVDPEDPIVKVTIPDHSYQAVHAFLRFLYTDCFEVHSDLLPELFELASLYLIPELQLLCISQMRVTLTPTTCCLYYPITHRHSLPELVDFQEDIIQFASTRMSEVVDSAAYHSMEPGLRDNLTNTAQIFPST